MEQVEQVSESGWLNLRYEALIRLAGAIRESQGPAVLFRLLVDELRRVIQFDGIAQYDDAANKMNWHLCEPCSDPAGDTVAALPREETAAWWVHQHQQPLVILEPFRVPKFNSD